MNSQHRQLSEDMGGCWLLSVDNDISILITSICWKQKKIEDSFNKKEDAVGFFITFEHSRKARLLLTLLPENGLHRNWGYH